MVETAPCGAAETLYQVRDLKRILYWKDYVKLKNLQGNSEKSQVQNYLLRRNLRVVISSSISMSDYLTFDEVVYLFTDIRCEVSNTFQMSKKK